MLILTVLVGNQHTYNHAASTTIHVCSKCLAPY
jgi:hypothetical protein